jgi:deoxyribodipyrimidine photolyase
MELIDSLPAALRERLRAQCGGALPPPRAGSYVLYMLHTAHRAHDSPALEVALRAATALSLPLVCASVVEDTFPSSMRDAHALSPPLRPTDRAAAFRLEALRELQPAFAARGTVLHVHVERDGVRHAAAMSLAAKAALVVTDEHYGVEPRASARFDPSTSLSRRLSPPGLPVAG